MDKMHATVLIVEPDRSLASALLFTLKRACTDVLLVHSREQALAAADELGWFGAATRHPEPQAIFTERRLPDGSGVSLLETIMNQSCILPTPIGILLSDYPYDQPAPGVEYVCQKPVTADTLIDAVRSCITNRGKMFSRKD